MGDPGQCRERTIGGHGRAIAASALPAQTLGPLHLCAEGSGAQSAGAHHRWGSWGSIPAAMGASAGAYQCAEHGKGQQELFSNGLRDLADINAVLLPALGPDVPGEVRMSLYVCVC